MRVESSVTAISWIPEAAIEGMPKIPLRVRHSASTTRPGPDRLEPGDLERLRDDDRVPRGEPPAQPGSRSKTDG